VREVSIRGVGAAREVREGPVLCVRADGEAVREAGAAHGADGVGVGVVVVVSGGVSDGIGGIGVVGGLEVDAAGDAPGLLVAAPVAFGAVVGDVDLAEGQLLDGERGWARDLWCGWLVAVVVGRSRGGRHLGLWAEEVEDFGKAFRARFVEGVVDVPLLAPFDPAFGFGDFALEAAADRV